MGKSSKKEEKDELFDPFAPASKERTPVTMKQAKKMFDPFLQSGPVESPKLMRRVLRAGGIAPPSEVESDSEDHAPETWSDEDDDAKTKRHARHRKQRKEEKSQAEHAKAEKAKKPVHKEQTAEELLQEWRQHQIAFIKAAAMHPDVVTIDFQRSILKAGVFEASCAVIEDLDSDREALLYALGLLKRLTSKNGAISSMKFSQVIQRRLVEESQPSCDDHRIRAFAITLLAAMQDKRQLEELGFYRNVIEFCSPDAEHNSALVENALAIALVNFSLDVTRQRTILDTITMDRLTAWAKSQEIDLKTCAAAFIGNLVANEECKHTIIHDGGLALLIKLLAAPGNPAFKAHAARGLANLALHNEAHVPMLERGVLQIMSPIINEEPPSDVETLRSTLRCLAHLSLSNLAGPAIVEYLKREPDVNERLAVLANHDNLELAKHAAKALKNTASHAKGKAVKKKRTVELVEQLLQRRPSLDDLEAWNIYKSGQNPAAVANSLTAVATEPLAFTPQASRRNHQSGNESESESEETPTDVTSIRLDTGERRDSLGTSSLRKIADIGSKDKKDKKKVRKGSPLAKVDEPEEEGLINGGGKKKGHRVRVGRRTKE